MLDITSDLGLLEPSQRERTEIRPVGVRRASLARRLLREPFLHFLVLGTALFFLSHYLEERGRFTRILITKDSVHAIAENYRQQYGAYPTPTQLNTLVEGFIQEEVYYHEAQKLGLDQDDEIVRRRLVQKYEFLQQDLAIAANPSEADLRDYFRSHADHYRVPAIAAFSQVFFSVDRRGGDAARAAAATAAAQLNTAAVARAPNAGDPFPGPQNFPALSGEEAERVFGQGDLTAGLFHLTPGRWSQPLRSAYGWHIIHIDNFTPARAADFATVRDEVQRDFLEDARAARNTANYAQLRKRFVITRE